MDERDTISNLLLNAQAGDASAVKRVFPLVYDELRRLARHHLQREPTGHTLATTDLVHQAYLHLVGQNRVQWQGRSHFMAIAATAIGVRTARRDWVKARCRRFSSHNDTKYSICHRARLTPRALTAT